jgi:hypothetical protein
VFGLAAGDDGEEPDLVLLVEQHVVGHDPSVADGEKGLGRESYLLDGLAYRAPSLELPLLVAIADLHVFPPAERVVERR